MSTDCGEPPTVQKEQMEELADSQILFKLGPLGLCDRAAIVLPKQAPYAAVCLVAQAETQQGLRQLRAQVRFIRRDDF